MVPIRQGAQDLELVRVFYQSFVADFTPPEDFFDHQERVFNAGANF